MRGIAREAGVSLATVMHHLQSKEAMWKAVIDELVVPGLKRPSSEPPPDGPSIVDEAVRDRLQGAVSNPGLSGRLLTDGSSEGEELLAYLVEATRDVRAADRRLAGALIESGTLRAVDLDALMVLTGIAIPVLSSAKSAVRLLVGPDLDDADARARLAASITDILLYGLLPR